MVVYTVIFSILFLLALIFSIKELSSLYVKRTKPTKRKKTQMIKKTKGGKYVVKSEKTGKNLSKPTTKKKAVKRLKQIEYFKHKKSK